MKKWLCLALALLTLTVCVWVAAESTDWNYDLNYAILRGYNGAATWPCPPRSTATRWM